MKEEYLYEDYQRKLKLLGDKSKFEILLFIKDHAVYGGEIAKHFGLTTATVSHHINRLLKEQLIVVEQRNKKLYCKANTEVLQEVIEHCKEMFQ